MYVYGNNGILALSLTLQKLKDRHMIVITLGVTGIAVLLLLLGTAIPSIWGNVTLERDGENSNGRTVRVDNYTPLCKDDTVPASRDKVIGESERN